jgi:L-iditol 2-dehydrogenase
MVAWMKAPVTPGHEFFGTVVALGEEAGEKFKIALGDKVIAEQIIPCGECLYCKEGLYHLCDVHNMYGFQKDVAEGAMAEYMKFSSDSKIHKLPDSITAAQGAVIEPLACAVHAIQLGKIEWNDTVVIAGAGPIGLFMTQLAALKKPAKLIVIDLNDKRLEVAKKFGADIVMNPGKEECIKAVKDLTGGYGCSVYVEASGSPKGVIQGLEMLRKQGRFIEFSVFGSDTCVDWSIIGEKKEITIFGGHISPATYPIAIDLLKKGLVTADSIVTHQFPLNEFYRALSQAEKIDESIKVLLIP